MYQYTTPTLEFELKDKETKELLKDLEFDYLIITLKSGNNKIEKPISRQQYQEGTFTVKLTQEETAQLQGVISAQANIIVGDNRFATSKATKNIDCNLHAEVISDD